MNDEDGIVMMEEWKKAWAAGILDFQGHVQTKKNQQRAAGSQQIMIYVDTSIDEIVDRLGEMTGANVEMKVRHRVKAEWSRKGCAEHCPEEHIHVNEYQMPATGRWSVTGAAAAIVLWNLREYLSTEREPWDWALSQCLSQLKLTGQGSAAIIAAARRLHSLGWTLPPVMEHLAPKALTAAG